MNNPIQGEAVGWETPEEWALETAAFNAANNSDVPEWARKVVADLWKQYCIAASPQPPTQAGVREIIEAVAHIGVDFGFGPYELEDKFIEMARALAAKEAGE